MSESPADKLSRVRQMSTGDPTWDLSKNDLQALRYVVASVDSLRAACDKLVEYGREACKHVSVRKREDELDGILADAIILATEATKGTQDR